MTGEYEVIMGVPDDYDIYGVTISRYNGDARYPDGFDFDAMLIDTHTIDIYASPSAAAPDLEFSVTDFSNLPGFNFAPGEEFAIIVEVFLGSFQDAGIGEDFLGPLTVTIPGLASLGDYV
jgi:hypothetical protein